MFLAILRFHLMGLSFDCTSTCIANSTSEVLQGASKSRGGDVEQPLDPKQGPLFRGKGLFRPILASSGRRTGHQYTGTLVHGHIGTPVQDG